MAVIFKPATDRVKLKIGEVEFLLSPLSYGQKLDCATIPTKQFGGEKRVDMTILSHRIIKHSVKDIKGVDSADGSPYKLEFEEKEFSGVLLTKTENVLTDECAEDILVGLNITPPMISIAYQLLIEIPDYIVDDQGKKVKGVSLEIVGKHKVAKKKKK